MTTTVNISTENDADFRRVFIYQHADATPIDISTYDFRMYFRRNVQDATVVFELTPANGRIAIVDGPNGKFELIILQADLEQLAAATYEQSLIAIAYGAQWRIWRGEFTLALGPSR